MTPLYRIFKQHLIIVKAHKALVFRLPILSSQIINGIPGVFKTIRQTMHLSISADCQVRHSRYAPHCFISAAYENRHTAQCVLPRNYAVHASNANSHKERSTAKAGYRSPNRAPLSMSVSKTRSRRELQRTNDIYRICDPKRCRS